MEIVPMGAGGEPIAEGLDLHRGGPGASARASRRHAHAFHQVSVIVSAPGRLDWRFDGGGPPGRPRAGDVVVCPAFLPTLVRWDRAFESISVRIAADRLDAVAGRAGLGPGAGLAPAFRRDRFASEAVLRLAEAGGPGAGLLGESLGTALLVHLLREYAGPLAPSGPAAEAGHAGVRRAIAAVDERLDGDLSIAALADLAGLSRFHFIRRFREATGTTPHRYVVRRRVERARELLEGGSGVAEAAFAVGFSSQSHLHHHVRRLLGVTPGELARGPRRPR